MFYHVEDISPLLRETFKTSNFVFSIRLSKQFAVNGSNLCVAFNISNQCTASDIVLSVDYTYNLLAIGLPNSENMNNVLEYTNEEYDIDDYAYIEPLGSFIYQPNFEVSKYKDLSLCEKSVVHTSIITNCSESYLSCREGTCIHDSLVCDGRLHCPHGEDEADCQHICSDHSHKCITHCHHRDLCFCSPGYFQSLSGGCVPLQYRNYVTKQRVALMHLMNHTHVSI